MEEVIKGAVQALKEGENCVLVTVVRTKGSTPQKSGAMLLVKEDGSGIGTLGGGCVEGDIWFAATEILQKNTGPEFKDYYLNEDIAARDGLVCGGSMYFFLDPLHEKEDFVGIGEKLIDAYQGNASITMATVVRSDRDELVPGSKLIIDSNSSISGTLGTQAVDGIAAEIGKDIAEVGQIHNLNVDDNVEVFMEGFTIPPTLCMVGGGHVGKATADLAEQIGFKVIIVDDREEFCNIDRFPYASQLVQTSFSNWSDQLDIHTNTFVVVATRGHNYDDLALRSALNTKARYIGLLGSKRKTIMIYKLLASDGIPLDRLNQIYAPVGLDIGALTPEEIALSIMSELVMVRRGGNGSPMAMDKKYLENLLS
ncbi:MAG: XdhC family protein [SAR202 cluster bacterium]|nr:XdhC family protein [SAR202 cluster bacterium]MQG26162.1 XdhC family protein [SAR202 cluster bacterium]MQG52810.1 XdhC family protein [SAR202 cluster bacterium]|tara:strand:- start:827 stop:1930 length:1104 start_codon:yes stop_codon:yes gene_type:complete